MGVNFLDSCEAGTNGNYSRNLARVAVGMRHEYPSEHLA
jgi:hypothetical protein